MRNPARVGSRLVALLLVALLAVSACGGAPASTPAASADSAIATSELVAKARASDHKVRVAMEGIDPSIIKAKEAAFLKKFGFPVILESEPGQIYVDQPLKVIKANEAGKGVVDYFIGDQTGGYAPFQQGAFAPPPWEEIYKIFPLAKTLRERAPDWAGPNGSKYNDNCLVRQQTPWFIVYNTTKVKADEVKGMTWEDLLADKWKGRLAWSDTGSPINWFSNMPNWNADKMLAFARNMGAQQPRLIAGGSFATTPAIANGQADIGLGSLTDAGLAISKGAPIAIVWPANLPTPKGVTCFTKYGVNNRDMAALYMAFDNFDGIYSASAIGGDVRLYPEEAAFFPQIKWMQEAGVSVDRFISAKTAEEAQLPTKYREPVIAAIQEGVKTGTKVPMPK